MSKFFSLLDGKLKILLIVIGIILGAGLGLLLPGWTWISIFGDIFVGALKAVAPVLVFFLVTNALMNQKRNIGKRFRTVIILYMVTTLFASAIAVAANYIFPLTLQLSETAEAAPPSSLTEVFNSLFTSMVSNPITAISNGSYIGILFWAVLLGLCLKKSAKESTKQMFADISEAVTKTIRYVVCFAPLGIMGIVFSEVSSNGLSIFTDYGKVLLVLVGCMLFTFFIVNPIFAATFLKKNPYPLFLKCLRKSGLYAFFTRSSAANIPVNMKLCEELGLDEEFYSVSIPLGATINMDGAAVTIAVLTLALCNTIGVAVHPLEALILCVVATLAACGASGVPGGSLLLIPMACSLFGIGNELAMQAVAVGFVIGVIQDSVETALNSSGDVVFTAVAEYHERAKNGEPMRYLGKED